MKKRLAKDEQNYVIMTDITCDLSDKMLKRLDVTALPLHVIIDDIDYLHYADYRNLSVKDFQYKLQHCNSISTSQADMWMIETFMRSFLEKDKDILYIAFSSSLSGTYASAKIVADSLLEEYPNRKIRVIDSKSASGGLGILVYYAAEQKLRGMTMNELSEWLENKCAHIGHWFTVDDLQHLKKGGRISGATSLVGGILKIKPILHMSSEGLLTPHSKASGKKKAFDALIDKMEKHGDGDTFNIVFISYSGPKEDAICLKQKISEKFKVNTFVIEHIDPVIAAHLGYGSIALFFDAKER